MHTVLSIAGSDCSGGAGIQADLKTITALHCYGMTAITAITAQNTCGVQGILNISSKFLKKQLVSIFDDIIPEAIKIGMVGTKENISSIIEVLNQFHATNIVVDPVMVTTSGCPLFDTTMIAAYRPLLQLATLITPNIPEAELLSHTKLTNAVQIEKVAQKLATNFQTSVLIKGGHFSKNANDYFWDQQTKRGQWLKQIHINNSNTHGTGCTLSSAIASYLASGASLYNAIQEGKNYVTGAIAAKLNLGHGCGPLNHMYKLKNENLMDK